MARRSTDLVRMDRASHNCFEGEWKTCAVDSFWLLCSCAGPWSTSHPGQPGQGTCSGIPRCRSASPSGQRMKTFWAPDVRGDQPASQPASQPLRHCQRAGSKQDRETAQKEGLWKKIDQQSSQTTLVADTSRSVSSVQRHPCRCRRLMRREKKSVPGWGTRTQPLTHDTRQVWV